MVVVKRRVVVGGRVVVIVRLVVVVVLGGRYSCERVVRLVVGRVVVTVGFVVLTR